MRLRVYEYTVYQYEDSDNNFLANIIFYNFWLCEECRDFSLWRDSEWHTSGRGLWRMVKHNSWCVPLFLFLNQICAWDFISAFLTISEHQFIFAGREEDQLIIHEYGLVTFQSQGPSSLIPNFDPSGGVLPPSTMAACTNNDSKNSSVAYRMIAPYWSDPYTGAGYGGKVYYRCVQSFSMSSEL